MFNNKIDVAKGFQTSVNIAYDLNDTGKISGFIPTMSSLDIIEDVLLSTAPNSTERARILIGAYGRGKSHIILVLLSLLYKKDKALFANLLEKMKKSNPKLYDYTNEFIDSGRKLLPIVVEGSSASLTQSFLFALQQALNELLKEKEKEKIIDNLKSIWDEPNADLVEERLDGIIRGEEYV